MEEVAMEEVAPVVLNERGAVEEVAPALNGGGRQALLQPAGA